MARNDMGIRRPGVTRAAAISTSAASTVATGPFCNLVRIATTTACFFRVGATATVTDAYLPTGVVDYVKINPGETVSFITATGTGTATVTEME